MQTNKITKWAAMLTVSGLSLIAPLTVTVQNLTVTSNTTVSGTHYENNGANPALINTSTWTFTGSDVIISGTSTAVNNGRLGAYFTGGGKLNLSDSRVDAVYYGIQLSNTSAATLTNTVINSGSVANGHGVYLTASSTLTMTGGTITTGTTGAVGINVTTASVIDVRNTTINSFAVGVDLSGASSAILDNVNITTRNTNAHGVLLVSSTLTMTGGSLTATVGGNGIYGLNASRVDLQGTVINAYSDGIYLTGTSVLAPYHANITTQNGIGVGLAVSSTATITGGTITAGGIGVTVLTASVIDMRDTTINSRAVGVNLSGTSKATLENLNITTKNTNAHGISMAASSTLTFSGGTIHTTGTSANGLNLAGISTATLNNVTIVAEGINACGVSINTSSTLTMTGGAITGAKIGVQITTGGYFYGTGVAVTSLGDGINNHGLVMQGGGTAVFIGGTIRTSGSLTHGVHVGGSDDGDALVTLIGADVQTTGVNAAAVHLDSPGSTFTKSVVLDGGTYASAQGSGLGVNQLVVGGNGSYSTGVFDITVKGGATVSGTSSVLIGGSVVKDAPVVTLNVSEASTLLGDVNTVINGTTTLNLSDSSTLTGNVNAKDATVLTVTLNDSEFTGKSSISDNAALNVSLDNDATWNMTDNSTVTNLALSNGGKVVFQKDAGFKTLTTRNLSGSGEFHMNTDIAANTGDLLIVSGTSSGTHQVRITNHGSQTSGTEPALLLIETADGQARFSGTVSVGMFDYSLYQDQTDWYLSVSGTNLPPNPPTPPGGDDDDDPPQPPQPPTPPSLSDGGKIILIVPPSIGQNWFDHTKTISNHLGDLRDDKAGILEALWVRSYGAQLNIAPNMVGSGVREYQYGVDVCSDHRLNLDKDNTLILGGFVGYGRIDRTLRNSFGSEANTDNYHAGLYAIWQHECGLWADVIAKGQYADSQLSAWDASQNHMTASYGNWGGGVTLDIGKKFSFDQGWFVEPSLSAGYAHFMGNDYTTGGANVFKVSVSDADLFQFRVGVAFGRTLKLKNSGVLQPYIKVAGVEQISTGGKLSASGHEWRPNFDGARAEVGGGIIWQLNADHQLSLDYEASFGDKYDKPWGLTAGYRYQF